MWSARSGIEIEVLLDGEAVEHNELFEATWHGRRTWPDKNAWTSTKKFSIFTIPDYD
ncbi:hypothetical protein HME9302_02529 [Alteripontixanthobacter maritimus]|uniref:Uncharacterized protein n=2 Tax=Alteripontixanthobacter maritimus TaxID=2161824 RepID=A0A369QG88_9SPHN|nr:hypothetical protein HME9302_02529 [Alteripontixanthobacter maritimus]